MYRALLLGAVPPALVTDAVRLLAAGRPGEGGGAAFLSGEAAQAYYGRDGGEDVSAEGCCCFQGGGGVDGDGDGDGGRKYGGGVLLASEERGG